jgi:PEP-CTERM motif
MNFLELKAGGKMRKVMFFTFLLLTLAVGRVYAQPYWIGNVNMDDDGWVNNVLTFDWAGSGSGMAVGIQPGEVLTVGQEFTFKYQSFLVDLQDPDGNSLGAFANLNDTYEYTVVSEFTEEVVGFTQTPIPGGFLQTAYFVPLEGDAYIFFDDDPNADVGSGMGFDDGHEVLKARTDGGLTAFTYNTVTGEGGGGTAPEINWSLNPLWVDDDYIDPTILLCDMHFQGTLNYPPLDSKTTAFFDSRAGEGNLDINYVTEDDMLFKVDGSSKLTVVPEPCTMLLLGSGLLGLGSFARKRKRAKK